MTTLNPRRLKLWSCFVLGQSEPRVAYTMMGRDCLYRRVELLAVFVVKVPGLLQVALTSKTLNQKTRKPPNPPPLNTTKPLNPQFLNTRNPKPSKTKQKPNPLNPQRKRVGAAWQFGQAQNFPPPPPRAEKEKRVQKPAQRLQRPRVFLPKP